MNYPVTNYPVTWESLISPVVQTPLRIRQVSRIVLSYSANEARRQAMRSTVINSIVNVTNRFGVDVNQTVSAFNDSTRYMLHFLTFMQRLGRRVSVRQVAWTPMLNPTAFQKNRLEWPASCGRLMKPVAIESIGGVFSQGSLDG
jgi:hypothetical protein